MKLARNTIAFAALLFSVVAPLPGCIGQDDDSTEIDGDDPEGDYYEGVLDDPSQPMDDGKSDIARYMIPTNLPKLEKPEIIVSLKGLTVHLFDRKTGFSKVYPAGPGVLGSNGRSITPVGHFKTGGNTADGFFYTPRRTNPAHFAGLPFLRLNAKNSRGEQTYALHGPITNTLRRGFVSHGCIRMERQDIINLFWMVKTFANTPVSIQQEVELDANGDTVDIGKNVALFGADEEINFGASIGPRR
jgi:hypothetical protein